VSPFAKLIVGMLLWSAGWAWFGVCAGLDWIAGHHVSSWNGIGMAMLFLYGAKLGSRGVIVLAKEFTVTKKGQRP
jgi:hypothetical protein